METSTCGSCKHFQQHYMKRGKAYFPIEFGHCVYPRIKSRAIGISACGCYKEKGQED